LESASLWSQSAAPSWFETACGLLTMREGTAYRSPQGSCHAPQPEEGRHRNRHRESFFPFGGETEWRA